MKIGKICKTHSQRKAFLITVIIHGLTMMIPLVLTGGIACALVNFPVPIYQDWIQNTFLQVVLQNIYDATFGMFSVAMVIALSSSYCMERNMAADKTTTYVLVALCAFATQAFEPGGGFHQEMLGAKGCFFAIVTALLSSYLLQRFHSSPIMQLKKYTFGMPRISAISISMFLSALLVILIFAITSQLILMLAGCGSMYELVSNAVCGLFDGIENEFVKGLLYTVLLHVMWAFGLHGSHILEPVATSSLKLSTSTEIFSKSFFDTFVVMGGCGATICVLIALLLFFRKSRLREIAKLSSFTVIFNLNEILTFGIPIILNPILMIPFVLVPILFYFSAFAATAVGLIPPVTNEVVWSTPIIFNAYIGTGSISASIFQIIMIAIGTAIYVPFLRISIRKQEERAKAQLKDVVKFLQDDEEQDQATDLLSQSNRLGQISRVLLHDLKSAIERDELYMLFQPQVDINGVCIGGEALLRWEHPLYGFIFPPLIIYLAKQGGLLEKLERMILDKTISAIAETKKECGEDLKISVNLTAKSLLWNIEDYIEEKLKEYDVKPSQLWIEITEQDVLSKTTTVINKIEEMKQRGHVMMIDDFGMGHTSILYLQSSQFGVVKLDGSLVRDITENTTNQEIVSSIVSLADKLGVKTIAEFVEDEEQRDMLHDLGCNWYQGYLYERPIQLEKFISFMKEHPKK